MRFALKPVSTGTTAAQPVKAKSSGASFFEELTLASRETTQASTAIRYSAQAQSKIDSENEGEGQAKDAQGSANQAQTCDSVSSSVQQNATIAALTIRGEDQDPQSNLSGAELVTGEQEPSTTPQLKGKAALSDEDQDSDPANKNAIQTATQQLAGQLSNIQLELPAGRFEISLRSALSLAPDFPGSSTDSQNLSNPATTIEQPARSEATQSSAPANLEATGSQVVDLEHLLAAHVATTGNFGESTIVSKGDLNVSADKTTQLKNGGKTPAAASIDTGLEGVANALRSGVSQDSNTNPHVVSISGQISEHTQSSNSQDAAIQIRPAEGAPTQGIAFTTHAGSALAGESPVTSGPVRDALFPIQGSRDLSPDQLESSSATGGGEINTARLIQTMSESEIRLDMHSAEFGNIAIRTSVSQLQMDAQINVDHTILGNAIAAHIPSLQSRLGNELGLNTSIEVSQKGTFFGGGQGQSSQQDQRLVSQSASADGLIQGADAELQTLPLPILALDDCRLDVRA